MSTYKTVLLHKNRRLKAVEAKNASRALLAEHFNIFSLCPFQAEK